MVKDDYSYMYMTEISKFPPKLKAEMRELQKQHAEFFCTYVMCNTGLLKLKGVMGYKGRRNDVIYCPPIEQSDEKRAVVYFGGDIQDFTENMSCDRLGRKWLTDKDSEQCLRWNLDITASLLRTCFPTSHIIVVRPAKIEMKTFSCFENFVPGSSCGVPEHTPTHYALHHLELLLKCISDRVRSEKHTDPDQKSEESEWWSCGLELEKFSLTLVGFSKGCVVLNQFLYEFHYLKTLTPDDDMLGHFVSRVTDMYWLDGGHPGDKNTWITSTCLLETLSRLGIKIHVHVTPYQVRDERRAWIGCEQKLFTERLRVAGADIHETMHFAHEPPDLQKHFQILSVFCQRS